MDEYLEQVSAALDIPIAVLKRELAFRPGIYLCLFQDDGKYHQQTFEATCEMEALTKAYEWAEQQVTSATSTNPEDILDYLLTNDLWEVIPHARLIQPLPVLTEKALVAIAAESS